MHVCECKCVGVLAVEGIEISSRVTQSERVRCSWSKCMDSNVLPDRWTLGCLAQIRKPHLCLKQIPKMYLP